MRSPLHRMRAAAELLAASPESIANDPAALAKLLAEDADKFNLFGRVVSLSADGRTALIGRDVAYIFVKKMDGSYIQREKLITPNPINSSIYSHHMSLSADACTAIIFCLENGYSSESIYVFTKDENGSYSEQVKLAEYKDIMFGSTVSLSADGRVALIGAAWEDRIGATYVFVKHEDGKWAQQAKLIANDRNLFDFFGWSVSLSADGQTALIGALSTNIADPLCYVFVKGEDGSWSQQAKLTADDVKHFFGIVSLSADGRTALISGVGDDSKDSVYVFVRGEDGSWSQQAKLLADDGEAEDRFGGSLSLSADGRIALIGAYHDDDKASDSGAAYVFVRNEDGTWSQRFKLTAEDGEAGDGFGDSVALSADGQTALIGAPWDDDRGENSGSAYLFSIPPLGSSAPVAAMRLRQ